jgi:hypothetical protein
MAEFAVSDFGDDDVWADAVTNHQMGGLAKPLKSSYSQGDKGANLSLTTYSVSDVMQGAALYRPETSFYNQFNQSISSDLKDLITGNGGTGTVLGQRAQFLPYDILTKKGFSDGKIAAAGGFVAGTVGDVKFNEAGTGSMGQFLSNAAREVGYTEEGGNRNKFATEAGHQNGQAWCATFVVAMAHRAGIKLPSESAFTPTMADGFKKVNQWSTTPQAGDVVFFDFPNDSKHRIQHVGIVEKVNGDGSIVTIEGNTSSGAGSQDNGGGVFRKTRKANAGMVGYGRPNFATSSTTEEAEKSAA